MDDAALSKDGSPPAAAFPSKATRANAWPLLRRMIAMSLVHWRVIVLVVIAAGVFAGSRVFRGWLMKPLLDQILVPAANRSLDFSAIEGRLWELGVLGGITLVATPVAMFFKAYLANWVIARVRRDVDLSVATKFLKAPLRIHRGGSTGDLLSRALTDAQLACQSLTIVYLEIVPNFIMLAVGTIALLETSWQLSVIGTLTVPPLVGVLRYFGSRIQRQTRRRQESQGDLSQRLVAILSGIKVIKAFRGQALELNAFSGETDNYLRRHMKVVLNRTMAKASTEALTQTIGTLILGAGAVCVWYELYEITIGTLVAFAIILSQIYKPLKALMLAYSATMESTAGAARLFQVLDMEEEPPDRPNATPMNPNSRGHAIRFRDVHFDYGEGKIISGVNLDIAPGEVIAIVGRTGTGKSTLMDLLLRFHDPTKGSIEIDGIDLRDLQRDSFLDNVAVVTQEPFLFDETISENIRYGKPNATDQEVREAAKAASADEFIRELPKGYDTAVGEFGLRLSGGQRQRITIARAILRNPAILIFDEATSSLDAKTERAVQMAIEALRGQRTIFLVAHRLTTIRYADRIVVLNDGRIAEIGNHESLMSRPGIYRELIGISDADSS